MHFIIFLLGTLVCFANARKLYQLDGGERCDIGSAYLDDDGCNRCACVDGIRRHSDCTKMLCYIPPRPPRRLQRTCDVGTSFDSYDAGVGCSKCFCLDGIRVHSLCALISCDGSSENYNDEDASPLALKNRQETCRIGTSFRVDCNTCSCVDGIKTNALCTLKECASVRNYQPRSQQMYRDQRLDEEKLLD